MKTQDLNNDTIARDTLAQYDVSFASLGFTKSLFWVKIFCLRSLKYWLSTINSISRPSVLTTPFCTCKRTCWHLKISSRREICCWISWPPPLFWESRFTLLGNQFYYRGQVLEQSALKIHLPAWDFLFDFINYQSDPVAHQVLLWLILKLCPVPQKRIKNEIWGLHHLHFLPPLFKHNAA